MEKADTKLDLLVGTYTANESKGIYHFSFDPNSGELSGGKLMVETSNPSYLVISDDQEYVYAVNEDEEGRVSSFKWDHQSHELSLISRSSSQGIHPCYIDQSEDGSYLAVANYTSGSVAISTLDTLGQTIGKTRLTYHSGSGPNTERQEGPHAHCSIFRNDLLYVVDLGIDQIITYDIGDSAVSRSVAFQAAPGDGPRHLVFHPEKEQAYLINELSNMVVSLKVNSDGSLESLSRVSSLPEDFQDASQAADIHLSRDGRFLYVTNRGHESLAILSVSENGELTRLATESTRGEWPRNFVISPDGQYLLVANQYSHNIVVFKVDQESGLLSFTGHQVEIDSPVCLKF